MNDITPTLRDIFDVGLSIVGSFGLTPYKVYLTTITKDSIGWNDAEGQAVRTDTPILVRGGYNPSIIQDEMVGQQLVASNGALTANTITIGPLIPPWTDNNGNSGGIDMNVFQQAITPNVNTSYWIWIQGQGLDPRNGNYFDVYQIDIGQANGIDYAIKCRATLTQPTLQSST